MLRGDAATVDGFRTGGYLQVHAVLEVVELGVGLGSQIGQADVLCARHLGIVAGVASEESSSEGRVVDVQQLLVVDVAERGGATVLTPPHYKFIGLLLLVRKLQDIKGELVQPSHTHITL